MESYSVLPSLVLFVRFIHVLHEFLKQSFLLIVFHCMNNYNGCTHPFLDRNLGSSQFWAVRNTATINIFSNALKQTWTFLL